MSVRAGQTVIVQFTTRSPVTGEAVNADVTPVGTLVVSGVDTGASVVVVNNITGVYQIGTVLPSLPIGAICQLRVVATVDGKTDNAIVWTDTCDIVIESSGFVRVVDGDGTAVAPASDTEAILTLLSASAGGGARTCVLSVTDGTDPLESCHVRVTKGVATYVQVTDVNGEVTFNLDDGTWVVVITLPGYVFAGASLVVNGDETATYAMDSVVITPSAPGFTTGYLTCYSTAGVIQSGVSVHIYPVNTGAILGDALDGTARTETSGVDGVCTFPNLIKGVMYQLKRGTSTNTKNITIPTTAGDTYELPSIIGN